MSQLDFKKLANIKRDFLLRKSGLTLEEFILVMLHNFDIIQEKVELVRLLTELFEEIDVNGD